MIQLKTPSLPVFFIALALLVLAMIGNFTDVPVLSLYPFWLAVGGYVLLALGAVV